MLDNDVRKTAQRWDIGQELLEHDQSTGRRSQTHGTNCTRSACNDAVA